MKFKLPKKLNLKHTWFKALAIILLIIALFYLIGFISEILNPPAKKINFGVTFSPPTAKYLRLDWKEVYLSLLDELNIKKLRVPTYWSRIEPKEGSFDFSEVDFMLDEAKKRSVEVILVVGIRQPRWPECHQPNWADKLPKKAMQDKTKEFIKKVIERYDNHPAVTTYQVENEPLFPVWAVLCDWPDEGFFRSEIKLARGLTDKKIMTTASGEWDSWVTQMKLTDVLGISLYREVYNPFLGYFNYPFIPGHYSLKSNLVRKLFAPNNQKTVITELQVEPWFGDHDPNALSFDKQIKLFPIAEFKENVEYAKKTSIDEIYLWGVEWWYFMKQNGYPEYWDFATTLFH
ncbi:beta-galactosidase [Candidatus Daviesbacteria bacterium]|nr:beta-galactosidase [Candidatus Daviesbacteria bacterium]